LARPLTLKVFEGGYLNQNVIRPRKYDALLFGQIVNRDLDLYAFWHSSQKNDPGLNIALYSNPKADKILENLRTMSDSNARLDAYNQFQDILAKDIPAVFLYSPDFIYVAPPQVKNISINNLGDSIRIIPLGGVEQIGQNCSMIEFTTILLSLILAFNFKKKLRRASITFCLTQNI
jgi:ABC-type transport system substrate-binding protein